MKTTDWITPSPWRLGCFAAVLMFFTRQRPERSGARVAELVLTWALHAAVNWMGERHLLAEVRAITPWASCVAAGRVLLGVRRRKEGAVVALHARRLMAAAGAGEARPRPTSRAHGRRRLA